SGVIVQIARAALFIGVDRETLNDQTAGVAVAVDDHTVHRGVVGEEHRLRAASVAADVYVRQSGGVNLVRRDIERGAGLEEIARVALKLRDALARRDVHGGTVVVLDVDAGRSGGHLSIGEGDGQGDVSCSGAAERVSRVETGNRIEVSAAVGEGPDDALGGEK